MSELSYQQVLPALMTELRCRIDEADLAWLNEDADLLLDLGLDSVQIMQILVAMETRYHITVPAEALQRDEISTVSRLAKLLARQHVDNSQIGEPELDIKVHCLSSCLCECFRLNPDIDHRPFYFAVWDAEIFMNHNKKLSYHSDKVNHRFFIDWFSRLYGCKVESWYQHSKSKHANLDTLIQLLNNRREDEQILVMLDLYQLPERENRFSSNPFPHYVLLENRPDPEKIWMWDPDFRWEGELDKQRVFNAILQDSVAGGYRFFANALQPPKAADIDAFFHACMLKKNLLCTACEDIVHWHRQQQKLPLLSDALRELPVLAMRKYAYEHAFAFYWRELHLPEQDFEHWCEEIETLVRNFEKIQFLAAIYADREEETHWQTLLAALAQQQKNETRIKFALATQHENWLTQRQLTLSREGLAVS